MLSKKFLLISPYAYYTPLLRVVEIITQTYGLEGHVIAPEEADVARIYRPSGKISGRDFTDASNLLAFHFLPSVKGNAVHYGFDRIALKKVLGRLKPDYIWVQDEFTHNVALQILQYYRFNRTGYFQVLLQYRACVYQHVGALFNFFLVKGPHRSYGWYRVCRVIVKPVR